jgi:hypothetical protein
MRSIVAEIGSGRPALPPGFAGGAGFEQVGSSLERAGAIPDYTRLW